MKKPIKEIQEQASKGPFKTDSIFSSAYVLDAETYAICNMPSGSPNKKANAQLIAHSLNMFQPMLEALELAECALELCRQQMRDNGDLTLWNELQAPVTVRQVLKDAQEVEV